MPHLLNWSLFQHFPLSAEAMPRLRRLAADTGETVSLGVRVGWYNLRVAVVYGSNDIYHRDRLGETILLQQDLSSRVVLAHLSEREFERYRRFVNLYHPSAALQLDRSPFRKELRQTRERGFAAEELPVSPGRCAVSLPVHDGESQVIASITVNGPVLPLNSASQSEVVQPWRTICDELEQAVRAGGEKFKTRYGHIDPDRIAIRLAGTE